MLQIAALWAVREKLGDSAIGMEGGPRMDSIPGFGECCTSPILEQPPTDHAGLFRPVEPKPKVAHRWHPMGLHEGLRMFHLQIPPWFFVGRGES